MFESGYLSVYNADNENSKKILKKPKESSDFGDGFYKSSPFYNFTKRAFDVLACTVALLILLPFLLIVAIIIFIDDPKGHPIFSQIRCGKNGKQFKMYKFRTMCCDAEEKLEKLRESNEMDGPVFKIKDDPRITRVGKFLRTTGIDELPQLLNIIKGDMSIVGPRPALPHEVREYSERDKIRLTVQPGLTCYWQIKPNRNAITFDEWMQLDLKYIKERSMAVDIKIIFMTVATVFGRHGC